MTAPRVVMIVDNGITGDSRVQKSAREMAARGWDVTLIGHHNSAGTRTAPPGTSDDLGLATAVWAPVQRATGLSSRNARRWRHPLAYRTAADQSRALRQLTWLTLDLQSQFGAGGHRLRRLLTQARRKAAGLMYSARSASTKKSAAARKERPPLALHGSRQWRYDDPLLADLEVSYAEIIDPLRPALIHAHDFRALPLAARAADRLGRKGPRPAVVYDAHEFLPGVAMDDASRHRGDIQAEADHLRGADAIITVSDLTAQRLVDAHGLAEAPLLVFNTPMRGAADRPLQRSLRSDAGVPDGAPLLVYVGAAGVRRGLDTVVEALPHLPGVHFATVSAESPYVAGLRKRAAELGVGDRFHRVDYVTADDVSAYVAEATIGLNPLLHTENHNLTIPTKLWEYLHGRLPILTSDVTASTRFVERFGIGLAHVAGDAASFAEQCRAMLDDLPRFTAAYNDDALLDEWSWERQHDAVDALYRRLTGAAPDPRAAALARARRELDAGRLPAGTDLALAGDAVVEALAASTGTPEQRSGALLAAHGLLFHRTLHFDLPTSPLADDPAAFLAGWTASPDVAALQEVRRERPAAALRPGSRVTVLGYSNLAWAPPVVEALTAAGMDARVVDLAAVAGTITDRALARMGLGEVPDDLAEVMRGILAESDAVWVEWAERAAVVATLVDPGDARIIVRLHAYEAFRPALHHIRWGRVDDLLFVGPHFLDLVDAELATSPGYAGVRRRVIPLWFDLARFDQPKDDAARHTLAVLKWGNAAKDAAWAVGLLGRLQAHDERYRLLLIGDDVPADGPAGLVDYGTAVRDAIAALPRPEGVELRPATSDVPGALRDVGTIVSSSVRESFHAALVEGAASRAIPVVRDWPLMRRWNGPARLFPSDWVVADLDAAAARVLALTADADTWRAAGEQARADALARFGQDHGNDAVARLLREER